MTKSVLIFFILIVAIGATGWALYLKGGKDADMAVLTASESPMPEDAMEQELNEQAEVIALDGGLKYQDLQVGTGGEIAAGGPLNVIVHYTGWLEDGTKFDSSYDRGQPAAFTIGQGGLIPGFELGMVGMKVGGTRRLTIPPALGYGETGAGGVIPPNATLVFQIELLDIIQAEASE